jgi:hypothetical protein
MDSQFQDTRTGIEDARDRSVELFADQSIGRIPESQPKRTPLIIQGMHGLGDNLYQRAVLKQMTRHWVYLKTPWPQIYADMAHVIPVRPATRLRTQAKNEQASFRRYKKAPLSLPSRAWSYQQSATQSILESLAERLKVAATSFDMTGPEFDGPKIGRPYIVVRPVTERREWVSASRGPLPEYVAEAVEHLRKDFAIVSVADLEAGSEWALEPLPYADFTFHSGELPIGQLLGLMRGAAGAVGGVGWIVPAALAYRVPLLLIFGGWGYSNGPHRLYGPGVAHSFVDEVFPDEFCRCNSNSHNCNKRISFFGTRARSFAGRLIRETSMVAGGGHRLVSSRGETLQR